MCDVPFSVDEDILKVARNRWMEAAHDHSLCHFMRVAYVQQWTLTGDYTINYYNEHTLKL